MYINLKQVDVKVSNINEIVTSILSSKLKFLNYLIVFIGNNAVDTSAK